MSFAVLQAGIQSTLQEAPRRGVRYMGIPASGPADTLSMALANRLVGNAAAECALEVPYGMVSLKAMTDHIVGIAGATAAINVEGQPGLMHRTLKIKAGQTLNIGAPEYGLRVYVAVSGGFAADTFLGNRSTCLPAGFGGLKGRTLRKGDVLNTQNGGGGGSAILETPMKMRQVLSHSFALRCVPGPDESRIPDWEHKQDFKATRRADRIGIEIAGSWPKLKGAGLKASAPVFPGAIQLTPSGTAFALLPDAQTTGGYPHVLQVALADRHLLGQIRPGDNIRFLKRSAEDAAYDLRLKQTFFEDWLPDLRL